MSFKDSYIFWPEQTESIWMDRLGKPESADAPERGEADAEAFLYGKIRPENTA